MYIDGPMKSLSDHKFVEFTGDSPEYTRVPAVEKESELIYFIEVCTGDCVSLAAPSWTILQTSSCMGCRRYSQQKLTRMRVLLFARSSKGRQ
jgi:hypothetical protein